MQTKSQKSEIYKQIKLLEREIDTIKMLHKLGKMDSERAKNKIKNLDAQLMKHVEKLPEYDKQLYLVNREFGKLPKL